MQKYFNNVQTKLGNAVPGASILVTDAATGAVATIYSDDGVSPTGNPLTSDSLGAYEFYAANGRYTLTISGVGIVTYTLADVLLQDGMPYATPEDFDAVGDGIADDSAAVQAAFEHGYAIFPEGRTYSLGGATVDITNSVKAIIGTDVLFTNGVIRIRPTDDAKRIEIDGLLKMEDGAVILGGTMLADGTPITDAGTGAVVMNVGDIYVDTRFAGQTSAIAIATVKDSVIGNLAAVGEGMGASAQGIKLNTIFTSTVGNVTVNGEYSMGCEVAGSSTRSAYAAYRTEFGQVTVTKPTTYTDDAGHHGFYLHGAAECTVAGVHGSGWGLVNTSNGDMKLRDNIGCTVWRTYVDRMVFTSDDNGGFTLSNSYNTLYDTYAGIAYMLCSGTGTIFENRFINFDCPDWRGSDSGLGVGGIAAYFEGRIRLGNTLAGNFIQIGSVILRDAVVEFVGTYFLRGVLTRAIRTTFTNGLQDNPQSNDTELTDCKIVGEYFYNPTAGTHAHVMRNVTVTGELKTYSFSTRVINADWAFVVSGANEPVTDYQPDSKTFKFVAYANKYYTTQTVSGAIP